MLVKGFPWSLSSQLVTDGPDCALVVLRLWKQKGLIPAVSKMDTVLHTFFAQGHPH